MPDGPTAFSEREVLKDVSLGDKYDLAKDRIFISGSQAIVRLALAQKERDRREGLNTAGYVTGYRGSPLGGIDQQFVRAAKILKANDIVFQPGLNEDLAATALWGAQQANLRGEGRYDGVFGIWYGKGPGVDRTGDAFRHANFAGTDPNGGVVALMGDDHTCESSTTAHQSEFAFVDAMMPVLNPAGVQEILDYGLYGFALSRFAGLWVGLKCIKDSIESTGSIDGAIDRARIVRPEFGMPPIHARDRRGLSIRTGLHPLEQEELLHNYKRPAALAFLRANGLDRIVHSGGPKARFGIVSLGKSWLDTLQALDMLGLDEVRLAGLGVRLLKVACPWPLEPSIVTRFADGLETILVVEEKRSLVETQVKEQLYGRPSAPRIIGKKDEEERTLFRANGALDALDVAIAIGERLIRYTGDADLAPCVAKLAEARRAYSETVDVALRIPHFCAGCPHNTSTLVPEGSRAYAGIGCHYMAQWMDRRTEGFTQMGGEGANWIGEAPFSKRAHVFQNLGDGTYNHSGYLAIRAAAAAGVNVTYKILYNDAVAMTGGQPHEGNLTVPQIAAQVAAEGAKRLAVVTDEPGKYPQGTAWPAFTTFHDRSELDAVSREMREIDGLTIIIYDQTCAAEKRRRRKRGLFPDPDRRVVINELVCEGCGDCSAKSNCIAVQPIETPFGRKRRIDQSACNKDFSCLEGFCPSFVTVVGGKLKKGTGASGTALLEVPEPAVPALAETMGVLITGVGGTGVVTIGAVLGMAAHLEGKGVGMIDMAGLAQKGGAVTTHMKLSPTPDGIHSIRIGAEDAATVIACDLVVAGSKKALAAIRPGETKVFANTHETYPGDLTRNPDFRLPTLRLVKALVDRAGPEAPRFVEAERLATALLGDSLASNMFMVGYAWQQGGLPLSRASIRKAIEMNGVAVAMNLAAFEWGRAAAHDLAAVERAAGPRGIEVPPEPDLDAFIEHRVAFLTAYQDAGYAARYRSRIEAVRAAEARARPGETRLSREVARSLFKLMAIKDEYEVARLYTDGSFMRQLSETFESWESLDFHMAPPILEKKGTDGRPKKRRFGPWMLKGFGVLARLKGLRGTAFDPFGYMAERRHEKRMLADYEAVLDGIVAKLGAANHEAAVALAAYPQAIRGYGYIKEANAAKAEAERERLVAAFEAPAAPPVLLQAAE